MQPVLESPVLVSADSHVFEPPTLWQERLPRSMRDRGPRMEVVGDHYALVMEGLPPRKLAPVTSSAHDGGGAPGTGARGGADAGQRFTDLRADGVVAEVIYPTFGLFVDIVPDPDLQLACARVYNDWCADVFFSHPDTFLPAAMVPVRDVATSVEEIERCRELGYRTVMLPTTAPEGTQWNDPRYDPIWDAAVAAGLPISMHVGTGAVPQRERGPGGAVINYVKVGLLAADTLAYFAASGILDRRPGLHVVFVETGAGWLAYACERMDEAYEEHAQWVTPKLSRLPSEIVRGQCHVTLGADRAPILARDITGVAPLMWASDYPHPEGTFPQSRAVVERIFAGVPADDIAAIAGGNAARVYGIDLDAAAARIGTGTDAQA